MLLTDGTNATMSTKTGVTLGTVASSASQPRAPSHLSGVPVGLGLERSQARSRNVVRDQHAEHIYSCGFCSSLSVSLKKVQSQLSVPFCFF